MQDKYRGIFRTEALELLQTLEQTTLDLESDPANEQAVSSVFRVMHTIKGSGAMFGYQHISGFTHEIEHVMDAVRQGRRAVDSEIIDVLLASRDHIRLLLDEDDPPPHKLQQMSRHILQKISPHEPEITENPPVTQPATAQSLGEITYRIRFTPDPELLQNGTHPLSLLRELYSMGECTCIPYVHKIPTLTDMQPESCFLYWDILLTTCSSVDEIRDVFQFAEDHCVLNIDSVDQLSYEEIEPSKPLGQILVDRGVVTEAQLNAALEAQRRLGQVLSDSGVDSYEIHAALEEQNHIKRSRKKAMQDSARQGIRVDPEKLDTLVDLVGELVTLQARLHSTAAEVENMTLSHITENLSRITDELRDSTLSIRMMPIESVFASFRRLVHDLSGQLQKQVSLITTGGETELDKTIIDRLSEPLLHIVRNAVDHGIEIPSDRVEAGKPEAGTIELSAEHVGATVVIAVTDDGRGIDRASVVKKASAQGLIKQDAVLSDKEIVNLLTLPGFSTTDTVNEISGRGVGMDVVKQQLENLGGELEVADAENGGTRVTMTLPLTLAIIDGLLIAVGKERYIIPLSAVQECVEWRLENIESGGRSIRNRGRLLPVVSLRNHFDIQGNNHAHEQVVVVDSREGDVGLLVDQVIGGHQTVIKNLGQMYRDVSGVSGATILGDGTVALIIDVQKLASGVTKHKDYRENA